MFRNSYGASQIFKEGSSHYESKHEVVLNNIDAVRKLKNIIKTAYGPASMSKLISNFLNKLTLTSDTSLILSELEISHPAAKILALIAMMQKNQFDDGVNFLVLLAAELLDQAKELIKDRVPKNAIIEAYTLCKNKIIYLLEQNAFEKSVNDTQIIKAILCTKIKNYSAIIKLTELCSQSIDIIKKTNNFVNVQAIHICKILGGNINESFCYGGIVTEKQPCTNVKTIEKSKVLILNSFVGTVDIESSSTVLFTNTDQMLNFSASEERIIDEYLNKIYDAGVRAIIFGGSASPIIKHYLNKYQIFGLPIQSKFELKFISICLGINPIFDNSLSFIEEIASNVTIKVQELGSNMFTFIEPAEVSTCSIVLRSSTTTTLNEYELAINNYLNLVEVHKKDNRFVNGAGAIEKQISKELLNYADTFADINRYCCIAVSNAFSNIFKILGENIGYNTLIVLDQLDYFEDYVAKTSEFSIGTSDSNKYINANKKENIPINDHFLTKKFAIEFAFVIANTILSIENVLLNKPSGGPKFHKPGHWDATEERENF